jgi:chromosome segregation ATPase
MNNGSERLDRITELVEDNRRDINDLRKLVEFNAKAIAANSTQIGEMRDSLSEAAGRTLRAVDELREIVEEDRVNFREHLERTDTAIAGINATLAILQQLMRDRN